LLDLDQLRARFWSQPLAAGEPTAERFGVSGSQRNTPLFSLNGGANVNARILGGKYF
jgi:hypothetical protein